MIEMPVANPTNCAFGGRLGTTFYVTSAASPFNQWERFGGCLFTIETKRYRIGDPRISSHKWRRTVIPGSDKCTFVGRFGGPGLLPEIS